MPNHQQSQSSFNQILEMMKNFRVQNSRKSKQSITLDLSQKYSSRGPIKDFSTRTPLSNITHRNNHHNVFQKLYQQNKQINKRKTLLEYQSRRSKQEKQISQCTFSPNIRSKIRKQYNSIDNQSFYNKNMEWLQRKEKSIKVKQIEKNQQSVEGYTFTPKINKFNKNKVIDNGSTIYQAKGVQNYLNRQKKVKNIQQFVQSRKKNPYSHVWNVKKGHFSYVK